MRALDARAIAELEIPGPRLMENAGAGAARLISREFAPIRGKRVLILCGKGNNGGDGFVVARRLKAQGARVQVLLIGRRTDVKGDAALALERWRGRIEEIAAEPRLRTLGPALAMADVIVDAQLGPGLAGNDYGHVEAAREAVMGTDRWVGW